MPPEGESPQLNKLEEWEIPAAFHFRVTVGDAQVSFCEVSGIECSLEIEPVQSGGDNYNCFYVPKSRKFTDLVLKRGFVKKGDAFFNWCKDILAEPLSKESIKPKDVIVSLLSESEEPLVSWAFKHAYPVKWTLGKFDAMKNEIALETITLKYYSFKLLDL